MPNIISNTIQLHVVKIIEDKILHLALRRSMQKKPYPGIWQVITGTIEENETALQTAIREIKEEIGIQPIRMWTIPGIASYFNTKQDSVGLSPVFGALVDNNSEIILSEEHDKYEWLPLAQANELIIMPSQQQFAKVFEDTILKSADLSLFEISGI